MTLTALSELDLRRQATLAAHAVDCRGSGPANLILLHGFGTDQSIWDPLIAALGTDTPLARYDHMGCGASTLANYDAQRYATLQGYADDLVEVLDAIDARDCTLVGHSVSGMISLVAAERSARIGRLVMIAASPRYLDDGDYHGGFQREAIDALLEQMELDFLGWARTLGPAAMGNPERPQLAADLTFSFSRVHPEILRAFARATFFSDHRDRLARCAVPVTVLQPSADVIVPEATARYLAAQLPRARFQLLEARGHYPHVSAPMEVAQALRKVLAQAQAGGAPDG